MSHACPPAPAPPLDHASAELVRSFLADPSLAELVLPPLDSKSARKNLHRAIQYAFAGADICTDSVIGASGRVCARVRRAAAAAEESTAAAQRTEAYSFFVPAAQLPGPPTPPPMTMSDSGVIVVCDMVNSSANIGAILRLCCNADARRLVFLTGRHQRFSKRAILAKAAQSTEHFSSWRFVDADDAAHFDLRALLPAGSLVIGIETAETAESLYASDLRLRGESSPAPTPVPAPAPPPAAGHVADNTPERSACICFLFGSESRGVRRELLEQCDRLVYIPSPGPMKSLNVSQAVAVVLFECIRQNDPVSVSGCV